MKVARSQVYYDCLGVRSNRFHWTPWKVGTELGKVKKFGIDCLVHPLQNRI